ncbi:MAG: hypothetical protein K2Q23_09765 [Bryobacteraceae bacterium]|nr:hypothetical protein [Bryobacteraceae bacterium]
MMEPSRSGTLSAALTAVLFQGACGYNAQPSPEVRLGRQSPLYAIGKSNASDVVGLGRLVSIRDLGIRRTVQGSAYPSSLRLFEYSVEPLTVLKGAWDSGQIRVLEYGMDDRPSWLSNDIGGTMLWFLSREEGNWRPVMDNGGGYVRIRCPDKPLMRALLVPGCADFPGWNPVESYRQSCLLARLIFGAKEIYSALVELYPQASSVERGAVCKFLAAEYGLCEACARGGDATKGADVLGSSAIRVKSAVELTEELSNDRVNVQDASILACHASEKIRALAKSKGGVRLTACVPCEDK